ncbi:hypothetical protein QYF36_021074 [Acer negundo]|nr:hypothetical protein QYF36_021074 [Acer negundo]
MALIESYRFSCTTMVEVFCVGSAIDIRAMVMLTSLVSKANIIAFSIEYRLFPEHPLPIAYNDSWTGLEWVATHSNRLGSDPWLNDHADFGRVFLGGESVGANIAYFVAVRAGSTIMGLAGLKLNSGTGRDDDPKLNPVVDVNLKSMVGDRVLVCVAEKDLIRDRGLAYYDILLRVNGMVMWSFMRL